MICRNDLLPKQILLNSCCCGYVECQWRAFYNIIVTYKYESSFYVLRYIEFMSTRLRIMFIDINTSCFRFISRF